MELNEPFLNVFSFLKSILREEGESEDVARAFLEDEGTFTYVEDLVKSDVGRLHAEEARLEETSKNLHASKAAIVLENYTVLLEASGQLESISKDLPEMKNQLQNILAHYSATEDQCGAFWNKATEFAAQRTRSQQQSAQLGLIQDLLEIPSLIDNLVRHGLYDDVVDLVYFVEKLSAKFPEGKVVQAIAEESRKRTWIVMNLLSNQLRTLPVQLLQALKIVSLERRLGQVMGITVEEHVRSDFLQARSVFINSLVKALPQKDTYQFLTKVLEICRLHFFDTMNYFLSVFPDSPDLATDLRILPHIWLQEELSDLCALLEKSLPQMDDNRLEPLFNQCMNFSEALSRFGSNIATKFFRIFLSNIMENLTRDLQLATLCFQKRFPEVAIVKKIRQKSELHSDTSEKVENDFETPEELFDFPILSDLYSALINALGRFRLCSISSLLIPVISAINAFLDESVIIVEEGTGLDQRIISEFQKKFRFVFVPAVEKVRDSLCPHQEAAVFLGTSLQQTGLLLHPSRIGIGSQDGILNEQNGH